MSDIADIAAIAVENITLNALAQHKNRHKKDSTAEHLFCKICHNEIPLGRRRAIPGVTLCISCQRETEE